MRNPPFLLAVLALLNAAQCGTIYWDGTGTNWNQTASWTINVNDATADPLNVPSGDDVVFSIPGVTGTQTVNLNQDQVAQSISVSGPSTPWIQGGSGPALLTLLNGITIAPASGGLAIGRSNLGIESVLLSLAGDQTWANNSGPTSTSSIQVSNRIVFGAANASPAMELVLAGNSPAAANYISGAITENGSAVLSLTIAANPETRWRFGGFFGPVGPANTYRGVTNINSGALQVSHPAALGLPNLTSVASGAGLFLEATGAMAPEALVLNGSGPSGAAYGALQAVSLTSRWTGTIDINTGSVGARVGAIKNSTLIVDGAVGATGTGELIFQTGSSASDSSTIIVNGNLSFPGQQVTKSSDGASSGTLILNGTNSYGTTTIAGGVLQVGNGGTTGTLGTGTVTVQGTLAYKRIDNIVLSNALIGGGSLVQAGTGTLTLDTSKQFNGTLRVSGGGTVAFDFTAVAMPNNLIQTGALILNGGRLRLLGNATQVATHNFSGTTISAGHSITEVNSINGMAANLSLGSLSRTNGGGTLEVLSSDVGSVTTSTSNVNGILGGYATFGNSDWAARDATGKIVAFTGYNNTPTAVNANRDVPYSALNSPWSIRFNQPAANSVTSSGIGSGGILVTPNVGANLSQFPNGISGANGQDLIIHQNNPAGGLTIGGAVGTGNLTKAGPGLLTLAGSSSGVFVTRIEGGVISIANDSALGTRTGPGTIVFTPGSTGTLQITGSSFVSTKGISLDGNGITDVSVLATFNPAFSQRAISGAGSLTKAGPGTLVIGQDAYGNSYTGATMINGGKLEAPSISMGGSLSGIGASSSEASNLVINGGTLKLTGISFNSAYYPTDRLFTIGPEGGTLEQSTWASYEFINSGVIALNGSNLPRTLTLAGSQESSSFRGSTLAPILQDNGTGATSLRKTGNSQWNLTGANSYTGGTIVESGILTASLSGRFGNGDVRVESTATNLTIYADAVNAIADTASLTLAGDGSLDNQTNVGYAFLDSGVNEVVGGLILGGVPQLEFGDTYGATGSGADHLFDDYFKGPGVITLVPEPSATLTLISGLGVLVVAHRFRRQR